MDIKRSMITKLINFLILHPEMVTETCNPRSIANFFNSISSFDSYEKNLPMIQMIGEGSVGLEFSSMFTLFINNKLDKLVSPEKMLTQDWKAIASELKACIGTGGDYRADIASVLSTRFVNYTVNYADNNSVDQKIIDRVITMCTEEIFAMDLKYNITKGIINRQKAKFQKILLNPSMVKMAVS